MPFRNPKTKATFARQILSTNLQLKRDYRRDYRLKIGAQYQTIFKGKRNRVLPHDSSSKNNIFLRTWPPNNLQNLREFSRNTLKQKCKIAEKSTLKNLNKQLRTAQAQRQMENQTSKSRGDRTLKMESQNTVGYFGTYLQTSGSQ